MHIIRVSLIFLMFATPAFAQTSAPKTLPSTLDQQIASLKLDVPRIVEIINLVAMDKDQPTKEIHDEFWGLILTRVHADPAAVQVALSESADEAMTVQTAFWQSLLMSARSHRVIITKQYASLRNSYAIARFTSNYHELQNGMLTAAATGKPYVTSNGKTISITAQGAEKTLARIWQVKVRLYKLYDPSWHN